MCNDYPLSCSSGVTKVAPRFLASVATECRREQFLCAFEFSHGAEDNRSGEDSANMMSRNKKSGA